MLEQVKERALIGLAALTKSTSSVDRDAPNQSYQLETPTALKAREAPISGRGAEKD